MRDDTQHDGGGDDTKSEEEEEVEEVEDRPRLAAHPKAAELMKLAREAAKVRARCSPAAVGMLFSGTGLPQAPDPCSLQSSPRGPMPPGEKSLGDAWRRIRAPPVPYKPCGAKLRS